MKDWIELVTEEIFVLRGYVGILYIWNAVLTMALVFAFLFRGTSRKPPTQ